MQIHPALNRFIAGFDMVCNGVRMVFGAMGPGEVGEAINGLRTETAAAFTEMAKYEAAVAFVLLNQNKQLDGEQAAEYQRAVAIIKARLKS